MSNSKTEMSEASSFTLEPNGEIPTEIHGKSLGGKCLRNHSEIGGKSLKMACFEEEIWEIPEVNGHRSN
jgi:hypothetical protein